MWSQFMIYSHTMTHWYMSAQNVFLGDIYILDKRSG